MFFSWNSKSSFELEMYVYVGMQAKWLSYIHISYYRLKKIQNNNNNSPNLILKIFFSAYNIKITSIKNVNFFKLNWVIKFFTKMAENIKVEKLKQSKNSIKCKNVN